MNNDIGQWEGFSNSLLEDSGESTCVVLSVFVYCFTPETSDKLLQVNFIIANKQVSCWFGIVLAVVVIIIVIGRENAILLCKRAI